MEDPADPPGACEPPGEDNPDTSLGRGEEVSFKFDLNKAYSRTISIPIKNLPEKLDEIIDTLQQNGYRDIETIQYTPGNKYEICFASAKTKATILARGYNYKNRNWRTGDAQYELLNVVVCGVPPEISNQELVENMRQFGEIRSTSEKFDPKKKVKTGVRILHFTKITKLIPQIVHVEGLKKTLKINYSKNQLYFSKELNEQIRLGKVAIEKTKTTKSGQQQSNHRAENRNENETRKRKISDPNDFKVVKTKNQRIIERNYRTTYDEDERYEENVDLYIEATDTNVNEME